MEIINQRLKLDCILKSSFFNNIVLNESEPEINLHNVRDIN